MIIRRLGLALLAASLAGAAIHCGTVIAEGPDTRINEDAAPPRANDSAALEAESPKDGAPADASTVPTSLMITIPAAGADPAFEIDVTEVTQAQYADFLLHGIASVVQEPSCAANTGFSPAPPYDPATTPHLPVVGIDWCDAVAYCRWAGKRLCGGRDGKPGLYANVTDPAKSEWLAACTRSGTQAYPYGTLEQPAACNVKSAGATALRPVGSLSTCEGGYAGVRDLVGNATEWVDLCDDAGSCAILGGSWRFGDGPVGCAFYTASGRGAHFDDLGFRCCR